MWSNAPRRLPALHSAAAEGVVAVVAPRTVTVRTRVTVCVTVTVFAPPQPASAMPTAASAESFKMRAADNKELRPSLRSTCTSRLAPGYAADEYRGPRQEKTAA